MSLYACFGSTSPLTWLDVFFVQCVNARSGYHIATYSMKPAGEPQYPGSSGCMLTVEEAYPHLVGGTSFSRTAFVCDAFSDACSRRTACLANHYAIYRAIQPLSAAPPRRRIELKAHTLWHMHALLAAPVSSCSCACHLIPLLTSLYSNHGGPCLGRGPFATVPVYHIIPSVLL